MSDWLLYGLALLYGILGVIDLAVAIPFWRAARKKPPIPALNGMAAVTVGIAIGGILGGILGIAGVIRNLTGEVVIPQPLTLLMLVVALAAPSVGALFLFRQLRSWSRMKRGGKGAIRG